MIEFDDLTVSYSPLDVIRSFCIIIEIASSEGLIMSVFNISKAFQNTSFPNPTERVYHSLPYLYLY